jgi:hypothetical protein
VRHRLLPRLLVAALAIATATVTASATPVRADTRPHIDAGTDPDGATVHVIEGSVTGASGGGGTGSGGGCVFRYVATTALVYKFPQARFDAPRDLPPAPSPFHQAFDLYCGDTYIATVWAIPQAAAAAIGAAFARELLARVEFPPVTIAARPARGLTGLESWFWIDGTDGSPITLSESQFGISVELEVRLVGVDWDFGDGPAVHAGLGAAYPKRSSVTHTFETKGARTVSAAFRFVARYRVDGGDFIDLGPVPRTVARAYDVVEVRSLLVR